MSQLALDIAPGETKEQRYWRIAAEWSKRAKANPGCRFGRIALRFIKAAQKERYGHGGVPQK